MIIGLKEKMRAAGFEPLVFEDAQDLLLDQLNAINGVLNPKTKPLAAHDHSKQAGADTSLRSPPPGVHSDG